MGHFGDVISSEPLGSVLKEHKPTQKPLLWTIYDYYV